MRRTTMALCTRGGQFPIPMNREKWDKAGEVFERALELEAEAREAFVVGACGEDATLLAEVRACLAAYETESFLEHKPPSPALAATRIEPATPTSTGAMAST